MRNRRIVLLILTLVMCLCAPLVFGACAKKNDAPVTHTVTFNANGGSFAEQSVVTVTVKDGAFANAPQTPTRDGYVFTEWYAESACETAVTLASTPITADREFFAGWRNSSATVTYYYNYVGAPSEVFNTQSVAIGQMTTAPATPPVRDGYTFAGWFTQAEGGTEWTFAISAITADTSLYARWQANEQEATVVDIEVSAPAKVTYYVGDSFDAAGMAVKAVYSDGTKETLTASQYTITGVPQVFTTAGTITVTVTASGHSDTFNVTVTARTATALNKTGTLAKAQYYIGEEFSAQGLSFSLSYDVGDNVELDIEDITFTCASFDSNKAFTTAGAQVQVTAAYGTLTVVIEVEVIENPNYVMVGETKVYLATEGTGKYVANVSLTQDDVLAFYINSTDVTSSISLTANLGEFAASYVDSDAGSLSALQTVSCKLTVENDGNGWILSVNGTAAAEQANKLYIKRAQAVSNHALTYEAVNGGQWVIKGVQLNANDLIHAVIGKTDVGGEVYTFNGACETGTGATVFGGKRVLTVTQNGYYDLYFKEGSVWAAKAQVSVSFVNADGFAYADHVAGMPTTVGAEMGTGFTVTAANPTLKGFAFVGWLDASGAAWTDGTTVMTDTVLTASWTSKDYTLSYSADGATHANPVSYTATDGEFAEITLSAATKPHHTFDGWYTAVNFDESTKITAVNYATLPAIGETLTLYAKFTPETYDIIFILDDGDYSAEFVSGYTKPVQYTYGTAVSLPTADNILIATEGYVFLGWYIDGDADKTIITSITATDFGARSFVADIQAVTTYDVTFDLNYGGSSNIVIKVAENHTPTRPTEPTRAGFNFINWYNTAACTDGDTFDFTVPVTAAGSAFAKWEAINYTVNYVLGDGTTGTANPANYKVTDTDVTLNAAVASTTGYRFIGWTTMQNGGNAVTKLDATIISHATEENVITLYAQYDNHYSVGFNGNTDGLTLPDDYKLSGLPAVIPGAEYGSKIVKPSTNPTLTNYTFKGWYKTAACDDANVWDFATDTVSGDLTLYAGWTENADDGIYLVGAFNDWTITKENAAAYKATEAGMVLTITDVTLSVGDEFKFSSYVKATGTLKWDLAVKTTVSVTPKPGITVVKSGENYKVNAATINLSGCKFTISESANALSVSLQDYTFMRDAKTGGVAMYEATDADGIYIVGNFTDNFKMVSAWSSNGDNSKYLTHNKTYYFQVYLKQYDTFKIVEKNATEAYWYGGVIGLEGTSATLNAIAGSSNLLFAGQSGLYNVVYNQASHTLTYYAVDSEVVASFDGTVFVGSTPTASNVKVTKANVPVESANYAVYADAAVLGVNASTLYVVYNGAVYEVKYTATAVVAESVSMTDPTKTVYYVGDVLDTTGITLTIVNNDASEEESAQDNFTFTTSAASYDVANPLTDGFDLVIRATLKSNTSIYTEVTVTCYHKLTSIAVTTPPTKVDYNENETLDLTGMVITATFNGGVTVGANIIAAPESAVTKVLTNGEYSVLPDTSTPLQSTVAAIEIKAEQQIAGLTKAEVTVTQPITVATEKVVTDITVNTQPSKTTYKIGEKVDLAGMVISVRYNDGSDDTVTYDETTMSKFSVAYVNGGDSFASGETSYSVVYENKSADISVTVNDITVTFNGNIKYDEANPVSLAAETANVTTVGGGVENLDSLTPTRDNYTFDGWHTDAACTTPWNNTATADITLYAKWICTEVTVTYVYNCTIGSDKEITERHAYGDAIGTLLQPVRGDGFTFDGWYLSYNDQTGAYGNSFDGTEGTYGTNWIEHATLYAKWTYTIGSYYLSQESGGEKTYSYLGAAPENVEVSLIEGATLCLYVATSESALTEQTRTYTVKPSGAYRITNNVFTKTDNAYNVDDTFYISVKGTGTKAITLSNTTWLTLPKETEATSAGYYILGNFNNYTAYASFKLNKLHSSVYYFNSTPFNLKKYDEYRVVYIISASKKVYNSTTYATLAADTQLTLYAHASNNDTGVDVKTAPPATSTTFGAIGEFNSWSTATAISSYGMSASPQAGKEQYQVALYLTAGTAMKIYCKGWGETHQSNFQNFSAFATQANASADLVITLTGTYAFYLEVGGPIGNVGYNPIWCAKVSSSNLLA